MRLLIDDAKLQGSCAAVFGLGGVGSYTCEALARAGIGKITLVDGDKISVSNINRQLIALQSTVGQSTTAAQSNLLCRGQYQKYYEYPFSPKKRKEYLP